MTSRPPLNLGESLRRADPRMVFAPDYSTIYVSVPKTGCTTIKMVVAASSGLLRPDQLKRARGWIHNSWREQDERWSELSTEDREAMLLGEDTFRFTSIRNPYERLVSCYLNKIAGGEANYHLAKRLRDRGEVTMLSFLKFVADQPPMERDVHCRAMVDLCYSGHVQYHDIIRYESFEVDLRRVMEKLNVVDFPIPKPSHSQRTDAGSHVSELLGVEECALIRSVYERDFETFGYSLRMDGLGGSD